MNLIDKDISLCVPVTVPISKRAARTIIKDMQKSMLTFGMLKIIQTGNVVKYEVWREKLSDETFKINGGSHNEYGAIAQEKHPKNTEFEYIWDHGIQIRGCFQ